MVIKLSKPPLFQDDSQLRTLTEFSDVFKGGSVEKHKGIDFIAKKGDSVFVAHSGAVIKAGNFGDLGNVVVVKDSVSGQSTLYSNLASVNVVKGQTLTVGEAIATVADSVYESGPVLHFEILDEALTNLVAQNANAGTIGIEGVEGGRVDPRPVLRSSFPKFTRSIQVVKNNVKVNGEAPIGAEKLGNSFLINGNANVTINAQDGKDVFAVEFDAKSSGKVVIQDLDFDGVLVVNGKPIFEGRNAIPLRYANGTIVQDRWEVKAGAKSYLLDKVGNNLIIAQESNEDNQIVINGYFQSSKVNPFGIKFYEQDLASSMSTNFGIDAMFGSGVFPTARRDGMFVVQKVESDGFYVSRYNNRGFEISKELIAPKDSNGFDQKIVNPGGQSIIFSDGRIGFLYAQDNIKRRADFRLTSASSALKMAIVDSDGKLLTIKTIAQQNFSSETLYNGNKFMPSNILVDQNSGEVFCSYTRGGSKFFNALCDSSVNQTDFQIASGERPDGRSLLSGMSYNKAKLPTGHEISGSSKSFVIKAPVFSKIADGQVSGVNIDNGGGYHFDGLRPYDSIDLFGGNNKVSIENVANSVLMVNGFGAGCNINFPFLSDFDQEEILAAATIHSTRDNFVEDFFGLGTAPIKPGKPLLSVARRRRDFFDQEDSAPLSEPDYGVDNYVVLNLPNNQKIVIDIDPQIFLDLVRNNNAMTFLPPIPSSPTLPSSSSQPQIFSSPTYLQSSYPPLPSASASASASGVSPSVSASSSVYLSSSAAPQASSSYDELLPSSSAFSPDLSKPSATQNGALSTALGLSSILPTLSASAALLASSSSKLIASASASAFATPTPTVSPTPYNPTSPTTEGPPTTEDPSDKTIGGGEIAVIVLALLATAIFVIGCVKRQNDRRRRTAPINNGDMPLQPVLQRENTVEGAQGQGEANPNLEDALRLAVAVAETEFHWTGRRIAWSDFSAPPAERALEKDVAGAARAHPAPRMAPVRRPNSLPPLRRTDGDGHSKSS